MFGKAINRVLTGSLLLVMFCGMFVGMASAYSGDAEITHDLEMRQGKPCLVFRGDTQVTPAYWVAIRESGPNSIERVVTTGEQDLEGEFLVVYGNIEAGDVYTFGIGSEENRFEYYGPYEVTITETDIQIAESGF